MTIFGLQLPPGAYVGASGELQLARGARVAVSHAEDLVVAYGAGTTWASAPSQLGLLRNKKTLVRVRARDGADEHTIVMIPSSIRAEVAIGPPTAVWPIDQIAVTVRLVDEQGAGVPEWFEPKIRVRVGIREVQLKWKRSSQSYRGVIPPPKDTAGPWVVRVDVQDGFGTNLAYEFLEVARSKRKAARNANAQSLRAASGAPLDMF